MSSHIYYTNGGSTKALPTKFLGYGSVDFDANYMVTSFNEKMPDKKCGWINAGIYCINRQIIADLPGNKNISLEKDLFPTLIGKQFFAFPQETKFIDIGTPSSYEEAETYVLSELET